MATILISGGTGLIGKALSKLLISRGYEVRILSRNPKQSKNIKSFFWDVEHQQIDETAFDGIEHIVHLAGESIADKRWSDKRKQEIINSRVNSMKLLTDVVTRKNIRLKSFVGTSAVGIYGMVSSDKIYSETDIGVNDFLSQTCTLWERSYDEIRSCTEKISIIRISVILSKDGGALKRLLPQFKLGIGSAIGSGKQYMPWIHIDDVVSVFHEALFNPKYSGIYNAAASEHLTNKEFSQQLAKSLKKPFFMPNVPALALKMLFGEMAGVLLKGSRVNNSKLIDSGFVFKYPTLEIALDQII